jgi:tetratricopeptide (TPR) repeat protein
VKSLNTQNKNRRISKSLTSFLSINAFMLFQHLYLQAKTDSKMGEITVDVFAHWLINNKKVDDIILLFENDDIIEIKLKRPFSGKATIKRLKNADEIVQLATFIGALGNLNQAKELFDAILTITPDDTSALNNYGFVLLNDMINAYEKNKKYNFEELRMAHDKISKAASIDKCLHEEPLIFPAYKNMCLLRAVEATYFAQTKAFLTAFLTAWMSIEMSTYRIFYQHLKEKNYPKGKIDELQRWNIDTIIEVLFLNNCDELFVKQKGNLDMLRKLRNHLIHGDIFEITEGHAKTCIDVALSFIKIKNEIEASLLEH